MKVQFDLSKVNIFKQGTAMPPAPTPAPERAAPIVQRDPIAPRTIATAQAPNRGNVQQGKQENPNETEDQKRARKAAIAARRRR